MKSIKMGDIRVLKDRNPELAFNLDQAIKSAPEREEWHSQEFQIALKDARKMMWEPLEEWLSEMHSKIDLQSENEVFRYRGYDMRQLVPELAVAEGEEDKYVICVKQIAGSWVPILVEKAIILVSQDNMKAIQEASQEERLFINVKPEAQGHFMTALTEALNRRKTMEEAITFACEPHNRDPEFRKFLGCEFKDLDQDIGPALYALFQLPFLKTSFSCSGHIASRHIDAGASTRDTHYVYRPGFILFDITNKEASQLFFDSVQRIVEEYPFASLAIRKNRGEIFLEMKDIGEEVQLPQREGFFGMLDKASQLEVPIEQAQERYEQFKQFWTELAEIAKQFQSK